MPDRGFGQHEAGIVGQQRRAAEHDHQRQGSHRSCSRAAALEAGVDHLGRRRPRSPRRSPAPRCRSQDKSPEKRWWRGSRSASLANTSFIVVLPVCLTSLQRCKARCHQCVPGSALAGAAILRSAIFRIPFGEIDRAVAGGKRDQQFRTIAAGPADRSSAMLAVIISTNASGPGPGDDVVGAARSRAASRSRASTTSQRILQREGLADQRSSPARSARCRCRPRT